MTTRAALELCGITKRFGAQTALDRVSMRIERGDCYGFIGHNGAGKTTTMRIALGLDRADEGVVLVDGFDVRAHPREARARMGALIETPGFQGGFDGRRNLLELARLQGLDSARARAEAERWFERVGLAHAGPKPVAHYSQGMRQRLGIAAALIGSPRYVLLDEPTNGLDPEGIAEMRALIDRLRREDGFTFLVSSHQLHELAAICNRFGVLRGGQLLREATTEELTSAGRTRWRLEAGDRAAAEAVVRADFPEVRVSDVVGDPHGVWLELGTRPGAAVLRRLVGAGLEITSFAPRPPTLEEIYLGVTHGVDAQKVAAVAGRPNADAAPAERLAPRGAIARMAAFDLRRYASTPALYVVFALPAVVGALACWRRAAEARRDRGSIAEETLFSATDVNAFEATGLVLQAGLPVLAFLVLGLASQSLAAELNRGTLRNVLLRPLRRIECVAGKALALATVALLGYALLAATAVGVSAWAFDFGDVAETLPNGQKFVLTPASDLWPHLKHALIAPLLPLLSYAGIGFLAGAIARTGATALGLALGVGVVFDLARAFAREFGAGGLLPSDHLPSPLSDTSFLRYYVDVSQGVSNALDTYAHQAHVVPLAWGALGFVLGASILQRRAVP